MEQGNQEQEKEEAEARTKTSPHLILGLLHDMCTVSLQVLALVYREYDEVGRVGSPE
jgi:hypothetical protein